MKGVFISHTHADKGLADAIRDAMKRLFGDRVEVHYSTNKELDGGIKPGEDWFRWIGDKVRNSGVAFVLLTPSSIQKPWVLWEAGAVAGAALASDDSAQRKLRPISYKLRGSELPTPFGRDQITDGLSQVDIRRLLNDLLTQLASELPPSSLISIAQQIPSVCDEYLGRASEAMRLAPISVTEASVQEWLGRIEKLENEQRFSEVEELHDWLNVAFGRGESDKQRPIDLRLHRKLGELYARAGQTERAANEFELCQLLVPRDVYILRKLGKAYLDQKRLDRAEIILTIIGELDNRAYVRNAENAALKSRFHIIQGTLDTAAQTLRAASEANPSSYYLLDLLGQVLLKDGKPAEAQSAFRQLLKVVNRIREKNIWVLSSALTATLVLDETELANVYLSNVRELKPSVEQVSSVVRGLEAILPFSNNASDALNELKTGLVHE